MVVLSSLVVPESPRWLAKQGRDGEAIQNLCRLRSALPDSDEILDEMAEIRTQIQEEVALTKGRTILELLERHNLVRILWALGVGFFGIWSGHNAILFVSLFPGNFCSKCQLILCSHLVRANCLRGDWAFVSKRPWYLTFEVVADSLILKVGRMPASWPLESSHALNLPRPFCSSSAPCSSSTERRSCQGAPSSWEPFCSHLGQS